LTRFVRPSRRFELLRAGSLTVVDDYAHHPEEVRATVAAARSAWPHRRLVCLFQPHRFTRTRRLAPQYADAFHGADRVIVTDIYAAGETRLPGVSSAHVAAAVSRGAPGVELHHIAERRALLRFLRSQLQAGDVLLGMGAGDLTAVVRDVACGVPARCVAA
jgi:UDP-N-acetylmuramate--alanine ligase